MYKMYIFDAKFLMDIFDINTSIIVDGGHHKINGILIKVKICLFSLQNVDKEYIALNVCIDYRYFLEANVFIRLRV